MAMVTVTVTPLVDVDAAREEYRRCWAGFSWSRGRMKQTLRNPGPWNNATWAGSNPGRCSKVAVGSSACVRRTKSGLGGNDTRGNKAVLGERT